MGSTRKAWRRRTAIRSKTVGTKGKVGVEGRWGGHQADLLAVDTEFELIVLYDRFRDALTCPRAPATLRSRRGEQPQARAGPIRQ